MTDREGSNLEQGADHRAPANVETVIRDLKEGSGLAYLPSGKFAANAAWQALATLAHTLGRWVVALSLPDRICARSTTGTLRRCLFTLPRPSHQVRSAACPPNAPAPALAAPVPHRLDSLAPGYLTRPTDERRHRETDASSLETGGILALQGRCSLMLRPYTPTSRLPP